MWSGIYWKQIPGRARRQVLCYQNPELSTIYFYKHSNEGWLLTPELSSRGCGPASLPEVLWLPFLLLQLSTYFWVILISVFRTQFGHHSGNIRLTWSFDLNLWCPVSWLTDKGASILSLTTSFISLSIRVIHKHLLQKSISTASAAYIKMGSTMAWKILCLFSLKIVSSHWTGCSMCVALWGCSTSLHMSTSDDPRHLNTSTFVEIWGLTRKSPLSSAQNSHVISLSEVNSKPPGFIELLTIMTYYTGKIDYLKKIVVYVVCFDSFAIGYLILIFHSVVYTNIFLKYTKKTGSVQTKTTQHI